MTHLILLLMLKQVVRSNRTFRSPSEFMRLWTQKISSRVNICWIQAILMPSCWSMPKRSMGLRFADLSEKMCFGKRTVAMASDCRISKSIGMRNLSPAHAVVSQAIGRRAPISTTSPLFKSDSEKKIVVFVQCNPNVLARNWASDTYYYSRKPNMKLYRRRAKPSKRLPFGRSMQKEPGLREPSLKEFVPLI